VIPASGHYCFVGLVGTAADRAPGLAAFSDWANFTTFISANNNVTWRNFNV
jgi:serine protease